MTSLRRDLLKGALGFAGAAMLGQPAFASASGVRSLSLLNTHTGEKLRTTYYEGGRYVPDAVSALNKILRDHRTGDVYEMDEGLLDLVSTLSGKVEANAPVQIISGYRSPKTNAKLARASDGVATRSLHMQGKAMDLRIAGVELTHLRKAALDMKRGGVGFYPGSNFIHVDTGRVRRW